MEENKFTRIAKTERNKSNLALVNEYAVQMKLIIFGTQYDSIK